MGINLTNKAIQDTYEGLVQISGSQLTDGTGSLIPSLDVSASFATTASYALNVPTFDTGSLITTASVSDATITFTKGDASTFPIEVNNVSSSISASYATTASFALNAGASTLQEVLDNSNTATQNIILDGYVSASNGYFTTPTTGLGGDALSLTKGAGVSTNIYDGGSSVIRFTEGDLRTDFLVYDVNIQTDLTASAVEATTINVGTITGSFASFTSASIGFLQTITGSATIIGDAFIILNNDTPTQKYAGLKVYDSGSANVTASLAWDGLTHDWKYEYSSSAEHEGGVLLTGPEGADLATLPYPANNAIQKGTGTHHLASSSMTDDGTLVSINANVSASGYVSASEFIGDGSQLTGIDTFPYTGSAIISGSLSIEGTLAISGSTAISSSTLGTGSLIDNLGQEGVATTEAIEHMVYCTQAEYDALTPDANTMYVIKGSGDVVNDLLVEGRLTGAIDVLTDVAGTTTLDCSLGNYFTLAMPAGGTTALTPTNITTGQTINIKITQNATASTLTYASSIKFPGGTPFTISTGSGNVDVLTLVSFDGTTLQATGLANFS